ncbi:MAG: hypothetical protein LBN99_03700 [Oscillospiraceae bacterium]|jgi:quercetin dioxygenase-like cupin family protein|nr:hypothetical protein [Oscillospiraceae bacterium]
MSYRYLYDLNDPSSYKYTSQMKTPDGTVAEDGRLVLLPEGEHKLFCFTDTFMHKAPEVGKMVHEHHLGFETFFVDSGSMDLYMHGKKTRLEAGSILHLQPYEIHGMVFHEDVKYRGIFSDLDQFDNAVEAALLEEHYPGSRAKMMAPGSGMPKHDFFMRGQGEYVEVPASEVAAVRYPDKPIIQYELDGVTLKQITGRWENGGQKEIWRAEFAPGFHAEWVELPLARDLFYVTEGEIEFKIAEETVIARPECLVDIPKFLPRSMKVPKGAALYDIGGLTCWDDFLYEYNSLKLHEPEKFKDAAVIAELKAQCGCYIKSFGK